jgi:hypothetical protein
MEKVKIVLDADVIIHFSKGCLLNVLPKIFVNMILLYFKQCTMNYWDQSEENWIDKYFF